MKNKILFLFSLIALFYSCKKDSPTPTGEAPFAETRSGGLLIANEGRYSTSTASLSYLDTDGRVYNDIYQKVNGTPLGDVLNSMSILNDKLYLVVNNSGKIVVCNPRTIRQIKTITGLTSPRYIVKATDTKAYVSDYQSNRISIIDLANDTISGSIQLNGWTEEMIKINDKMYVTNYNSDKIYIIDTSTDQVTDSLTAGRFGNFITTDVNGKIWLLCVGDYFTMTPGELVRIDPVSGNREFSYTFSSSDGPIKLRRNAAGTQIYLINNGIVTLNANASSYPSQPLIQSSGEYFYALFIDPSGKIITGDAVNFVQNGTVKIYSASGSVISSFKTGIAPTDFLIIP